MSRSSWLVKTSTMFVLVFVVVNFVNAEAIYWNGAGTSWDSAENWSQNPSATTPHPEDIPLSTDEAIFSITGVATPQTILLNANQTVYKLNFLADSIINGGNANQTLHIGAGGIELASEADKVIIGSTIDGQKVNISLKESQVWTNAAANPLVVNNNIDNAATATLTFKGSGGYILNGEISDGLSTPTTLEISDFTTVTLTTSNSYSGTTTVTSGSTLILDNNCALGSGTLRSLGGNLSVINRPRVMANKFLVEDNAGISFSGNAALTLTGTGSEPAFAIRQYSAPGINVLNTAPIEILGVFSLSDTSNSVNNGARGPSLSSSANFIISGPIQDNNNGNLVNSGVKGADFNFYGTGGNLTIIGNNNFGVGGGSVSSTYTADTKSGYNTITVGGPGGAGATITPFGGTNLTTNAGHGVYLKALEDGQILGNGIKFGPSTNNDGGTPLGFDGTNSLILGGSLEASKSVSFFNLASAPLIFAGGMNNSSDVTLTFKGNGDTVFSPTSKLHGAGIGKAGKGTLTIAGENNLTTSTILGGGTTIFDYSILNDNKLAQGSAGDALTLAGVELKLKGGSYAQTLGIDGGTTILGGMSKISQTDGGSSTLALGKITRSPQYGSAINIEDGVASTTSANVNGIIGGYAIVDGSDWATSDGNITKFHAYDSFSASGVNKNILVIGDDTYGGGDMTTLKIAPTAPNQSLTLSGTLTLKSSGLLLTGSEDYTITGSKIRGRTDYKGDFIVHHNSSGVLTIESEIANGNVTALVKTGPGELVLANSNNKYVGPTFLLDGMLTVSENKSLGTEGYANALNLNGGTLRAAGGFTTTRKTVLDSNGGTIKVDAGTLEMSGEFSGYGDLTKIGIGTLKLSGNNKYSGTTRILEGTFQSDSDTALGSTAATANRSHSPVIVDETGILDIAGYTNFIGNFTLANGSLIDSVGTGVLGAYSFNIENGNISAALTDVVLTSSTRNKSDSIVLRKNSSGIATISSTSDYTGNTFINDGVLFVNGELTHSAVNVYKNGTLKGNGKINNSICVEEGIIAPSFSDTISGNLTVGEDLTIINGTFNVIIDSLKCGKVTMVNPNALVSLMDAKLSIETLPGASFAELTIIDNQGDNEIQGTFKGLPEGSNFTYNDRSYNITYQGGDGNDVVLTSNPSGTLIIIQ